MKLNSHPNYNKICLVENKINQKQIKIHNHKTKQFKLSLIKLINLIKLVIIINIIINNKMTKIKI